MSEVFITFLFAATLLVISPGPSTALLLKNVPAQGIKKGFLNIAGIVAAINIHGLLALLGISSILLTSARVFVAVKIAGALYLFYLGVKAIIRSYSNEGKDLIIELSNQEKDSSTNGFAEGLFTNLLNPKPALFYMAVFTQLNLSDSSFIETYSYVLLHSLIAIIWYTTLVFSVNSLSNFLSSTDSFTKYTQRFTGIILIYFSFVLAMFKR